MQITMRSPLSGKHSTRDIAITQEQLDAWNAKCASLPSLIQDAFPHLSDDDREFMLTGITPEEWDEHFSEEN